MTVHNFGRSLTLSHQYEEWDGWRRIYCRAFPGYSHMESTRDDRQMQKAGIDRIIHLEHGKELTVDEKVRPTSTHTDIMLEVWSARETRAPGWVCKPLKCDYIAYAIVAHSTCYLLPVPQLQAAWRDHGQQWTVQYGLKIAPNEGYTTQSVPVPTSVVFQAMGQQLRVAFDNSDFPH